MKRAHPIPAILGATILLLATTSWRPASAAHSQSADSNKNDNSYKWDLPKGFPKPYIPPDNPMTAAKVELGRYLFYDTRMSVNGRQSCASCHKQELAFTDGRANAVGSTGQLHSRSAMSLVNIAWSATLTWNNPQLKRLEDQALIPMYSDQPVELGLRKDDKLLPTLRSDPKYQHLFAQAFPDNADPFTLTNVVKAIASFERSIVSARSPYDRYHSAGDDNAISASAKRGEVLYFSQHISCFRCHGGFNFTDSTISERNPDRQMEFHNTGLYNLSGQYSYPTPNVGIYEYTKQAADIGKFKAPTLRNIALTAPYMHDGSIPNLDGVLDHYSAGGRSIASGPHTGNGHNNPNKDPLIGGFPLSTQDRQDMIEFLKTLTDEALIHDPRFANPWPLNH
jgi:cytochrome c peroxidase